MRWLSVSATLHVHHINVHTVHTMYTHTPQSASMLLCNPCSLQSRDVCLYGGLGQWRSVSRTLKVELSRVLTNGTDSERSFVNDCIARSGRVESGRSVSLSVCLSCLYHHIALLAATVLLSLSLSLYCCLSACSPASFSACLYVSMCLSACVCVMTLLLHVVYVSEAFCLSAE